MPIRIVRKTTRGYFALWMEFCESGIDVCLKERLHKYRF